MTAAGSAHGDLAIAGVMPREVVTPRDRVEFSHIVADLHAARKAFAFVGGGTELALGNAPSALDTAIRTSALDEVVDYAPEDQTITVEAGMTLADIDRVLAPHRQMLPLDVLDRDRATIGGVVATNTSGRRRQRYGAVKDLIVGVSLVRPDGVVARGGGKVVKNVAGFDLPKLMTGSLGTLGGIATVTVRVYPIPESVRAIALTVDTAEKAAAAARAVHERKLEPESVVLYNYRTLVLTFAGTAAGVAEQMRTVELAGDEIGAAAAELTDLERESYEQRERAVRRDGDWRVRIVAPPSCAVATLGAFVAAPPVAVPVAYPLLGIARHAYPDAAGENIIGDLRRYVAAATNGTGRVIVHAMPDAARAAVDAWHDEPLPELAVMRAMKNQFDPLGLCNPGRFIGGLS
ncbi:FAD-linked oxidase [Vulcanimicrobium alpinum]|uniref:FAD-linked oxidase n=1 Tax=Vulcanimicrobium alpinum TaxID=3016050 RepID=A0AAN1XVE8_UNVUL|nr:FAD-binding oxidoreductase [Vulcanimicrobium alpinum]BDE05694.1 FAD-linked oxidase [Vulcanimicrobium alpinum]